mgnify:CR=1 FL=1
MQHSIEELEELARKCRIEIVKMVYRAQAGHPGGSLSEIDLLAGLYGTTMRVRSDDPDWEDRDRFILSKGHASPGMYALLAERGFISHDDLTSYRVLGGVCQGHVDMKWCPGVDFSAGSLGMGLSFGMGCAVAAKLDGSERRAFVMLGDGEIQEGQIWEAAMSASKFKTNNLIAIIDFNKVAQDNITKDLKDIEPIEAKWESFGWDVHRIDGHNMTEIMEILRKSVHPEKPRVIIADTIKGKGVSFMEGQTAWHGVAPSKEDYEKALKELE